ncbi:17914_t:CDS:2, partial [Racocetra persica]
MTEKQAREILNTINNGKFLIRIKFIQDDSVYGDEHQTKIAFKIIDKYEPIRESKKVGRKYAKGGPNVILTKKMKLGFWVGIDKKFLVREVSKQSEVERLESNTVVYELYRIRKPDINRLMPIKDGVLNCVAQRVVEHFDQAKRGHGLTNIYWQKIDTWKKKMRIPGARVQDVADLEKIFKRPIKLLDITHSTIFNSGKYQSDRMVEYYKDDTWEAISNALREPQAIWLMGKGIINEKKKLILSESLKVVDLAEQIFGANYAKSRLANEINEWHPISGKINDVIRQACVEHRHASMQGQGEYAPWFNRFRHPTHHLVRVAVNRKLPKDDITGFAQIRSFKFAPNIYPVIPVWYGKHFASQNGKGCVKSKEWALIVLLQYLLETGILEDLTIREVIISLTQQTKVWLPENRDISCAIIDKFTQGGKIDEKRLTHRLVTDEGKLDFLIKDCTDARTFARREKCLLGFILIYYEGHQSQYTHLRTSIDASRFDPNEVVRIATDSIYVQKEALYKIENIPAFFKQVE